MQSTRMGDKKNQTFNEDFLKSHAHLFIVDIDRLAIGETLPKYEKRERGYGKACFNAYHTAFDAIIDRKISVELLKTIHAAAIAHLPEKSPGQFRSVPNHYPLGLKYTEDSFKQRMTAANPTATLDGFWQFVEYWLIQEKEPVHFLHFKSDVENIYFTPVNAYGVPGLWLQKMRDNSISVFDFNSSRKDLVPFIQNILGNSSYRCFINSLGETEINCLKYKKSLQQIMHERTERICGSYNQQILTANTEQDKLEVIIRHVQLIDQLHPFQEGNTRTCYILLNRLLHEEGLSMALLINPNRFDGFSIPELIVIVKQAQQYFQDLVSGVVPLFKDEYLTGIPPVSSLDIPQLQTDLCVFIEILRKHVLSRVEQTEKFQADAGHSPRMFSPVTHQVSAKLSDGNSHVLK